MTVLSRLPISLPAKPGEPAFSLLARNAEANGRRTLAEFCTAVGMEKNPLCAGDPGQVAQLAALTGSDCAALLVQSPRQIDRKYTDLLGQRFLTRSIRKDDLAICPVCWIKQGRGSRMDAAELAIRADWLPRTLSSCARHGVALLSLPYVDYTTCYDPPARCRADPNWLYRLEERIVEKPLSRFERAVLGQLNGQSACPWLPDLQIDVLERWCLGLGVMTQLGGQSPVELDTETQSQLIDEGFAVTLAGHDAIQSAVDKALGKFHIRLSAAWLHGWALQSANPEERGALRKLMRQMGRDQGQYCLLSVTPAGRRDVQVDVAIRGIARDTGRPRKWVRKVMIADWLLHPDGSCRSRDVSARMSRARKHVIALASSLSTTEAAARLGISVAGFQRLVGSGALSPIRTRAFRKARFLRADLVDMKMLLDLPGQVGDARTRIALNDAAAVSGCSSDHAVRLLIRGCLPSAVLVDREAGLDGILVCEAEWNAALQASDLGLAEAARAMGIEEEALRKLRYSGLFPMRQGLSSRGRGIHHLIAWASFQKFCKTYLTLPLAAQRFGLSVPEVRRLVREAGLPRAPGAVGVPIYAADRLGSLIASIRAAEQAE